MGVILDTSLLIAAERGSIAFEPLLDSFGSDHVAIAAITASELLRGCHRAANPGIRARRSAWVEALLEVLPVVPFGLAAARRHAQLWADLSSAGTVIGPHDMIIGATAIAQGCSIATLNRREFERVPGVNLVPVDAFLT